MQFFVFDAKSYLTTTFLKIGYQGLTVAFLFLTIVFAFAAWAPA